MIELLAIAAMMTGALVAMAYRVGYARGELAEADRQTKVLIKAKQRGG